MFVALAGSSSGTIWFHVQTTRMARILATGYFSHKLPCHRPVAIYWQGVCSGNDWIYFAVPILEGSHAQDSPRSFLASLRA